MRTRLRHAWETLTTGYWFVPLVMLVGAAFLAISLLYLDRHVFGGRVAWLYAGGAEGAKTLLSTIAGSVVTVAGVVFSITIAALTQASSQFGPRLLRNFMRDTGNKVVLGTFVATFLYCLLVLRTIHGRVADGVEFVPQASVTVAVLLAVASIAVLIYFIHHVSVSLQAPAVVAAVLDDFDAVIARLPDACEESRSSATPGNGLSPDFDATAASIPATKRGYVQAVDYDGLLALAEEADLVLRLSYRPGDYVIEGSPLLHASPAVRRAAAEKLGARANAAFICGRHATSEQDVEQAVRQIVEVAVRALSPGVNDPFTAINCIDALGSAVCSAAGKALPGPHRYDRGGTLRIVTPVVTFDGLVDTAFNQIRQYGQSSVAVTIRLLEVITKCAAQDVTPDQRASLARHAEMVHDDADDAIKGKGDREAVDARWQIARRVLGADSYVAASARAGEQERIY